MKFTEEYFDENLKLFCDPETQPEKYNLYHGLFSLATDVSDLQRELKKLRRNISLIQTKIHRKSTSTG
jgi:hypothetical protein